KPERSNFTPVGRIKVIVREIKLTALRVNCDGHGASDALRLRLSGQTLNTADAQELDAARPGRQLPALRQRNNRTNAGVGAWSKANSQVIDLLPIKPGLAQSRGDHAHLLCDSLAGQDYLTKRRLPRMF